MMSYSVFSWDVKLAADPVGYVTCMHFVRRECASIDFAAYRHTLGQAHI